MWSLSRARKACRAGAVVIHRGPLRGNDYFDPEKGLRGRAMDRVYSSDVFAERVRINGALYSGTNWDRPRFNLPIVFEDNYFAISACPNSICSSVGSVTTTIYKPFAEGEVLTLVEMKPKTGLFHQLRRHMVSTRRGLAHNAVLV